MQEVCSIRTETFEDKVVVISRFGGKTKMVSKSHPGEKIEVL